MSGKLRVIRLASFFGKVLWEKTMFRRTISHFGDILNNFQITINYTLSEAYLGPCQTYMMKLCENSSIIDAW